ncbi:SO_0444 family Cu/Zn efflux transporter [Desulfobacterota bacterium M19]
MFSFTIEVLSASWILLLEAAVYILFGIAVGGLLKMFLSTEYVVRHLGSGRYRSVFKAALFGIPIPLCSCGVLPAAASLKKQGANNGATTAFLISTPESGVDSIAITYALLDPIMTVARPIAAFCSAFAAGLLENFFNPPKPGLVIPGAASCPVDNCCDGIDCDPAEHRRHHSLLQKIGAGLKYAVGDLWGELAGWFFAGILLAGLITTLVPDNLISAYLGGGLSSMLLMLAVGIPLYICATASTPIAAALILKGVSPGAALVFLLVGPATNMASLSVLTGLLGKWATVRYLAAIAVVSVLCGLILDAVYSVSGISASAVVGKAAQIIPQPVEFGAAVFLIAISIKPITRILRRKLRGIGGHGHQEGGCGCSGSSCTTKTVIPLSAKK